MTLSSLALWIINKPVATIIAVLASIAVFWLLRPRDTECCGELEVEGWRVYVMLASATVFFFVAEVALWAFLLAYRAPLPFTSLLRGFGVMLVAFAPLPLMAGYCRCASIRGRPLVTAAVLLSVGVASIAVGARLRDSAWTDLAARAATDRDALHEVVTLRGYLYLTSEEARQVVTTALPDVSDVLALEAAASESDELFLDSELAAYVADRIDGAASGDLGGDPGASGQDAVPAIWRLTRSPERTLRTYASSSPELRSALGNGGELDHERIVLHAMAGAPDDVVDVVGDAALTLVGRTAMSADTIRELAEYADGEGTSARVAMTLLMGDASSAALRPLATRFNDPDDAVWEVLAEVCPARTGGFARLAQDSDGDVAAGAGAALAEVRRSCTDWSVFTGP